MLEAKFFSAALLKKIVEAMKDLVTEASFEFSETGLELQAMDTSHVSLCYLKLEQDSFQMYRCDQNKSLDINLPSLATILKCASNDDTLTIKALENDDCMSIMFTNPEKDRIMDFEMKLMDIDQEQLDIPKIDYLSTVQIPAVEFKKIISDLTLLGNTCFISCKKEGVQFSVKGDIGNANITLKPGQNADDNGKSVLINVDEPLEFKFALRYLNLFAKATPLSKMVKLSMADGVPLLVEYQMEQGGAIRYYLAPKIGDEDDEEGEAA